jgi:phosphatidate cytidylyltransferase
VLAKRLLSSFLLIGVLIGCVGFPMGPTAIFAFVVVNLLGLSGILEYFRMLEAKGLKVFKLYGAAATVVFITIVFFTSYFSAANNGMEYAAILVVVIGLFILQAFEREPGTALGNITGILSGFVYVPWLWSFIFKVIYYPGVNGKWFVFALFLIVKGGDMLAYTMGSSIGMHKLIPRISPKKTWEGAAGGLIGGLIAGLIVWGWFPCGLSLGVALIMGAVLNVIGQVGDLAESMLKRDANMKDSSGFIPGMGGALDLLDSLLLTLPALYFYLAFFR